MNFLHTLILIVHVLGATIIVGVAFSALYIELRKPVVAENIKLIGGLFKTIQVVYLTQLLSGFYLGWSEWETVGKSPLFWLKFILFLAVALGARVITGRERKRAMAEKREFKPPIAWGWVSFLTVALIAIFGVILTESAA